MTNIIKPPRVGKYWEGQGGVLAGTVRDGDTQWHLILGTGTPEPVKDNKYEIAHCAFKGSWGKYQNEIPGEFSLVDGQNNTQLILAAEPSNNLALSISGLVIDGHKDFYLASIFEEQVVAHNLPEFISDNSHWSSTQHSGAGAFFRLCLNNYQCVMKKDGQLYARAVRRVLAI